MTRARDLADFNLDGKAVTINESSADLDFRVEGNGNANMLVVDAGNDRIGIATASPNNTLDVNGGIVCSPNTDGKDTFELSTNSTDEGRLRIKNDDTTTVQIRAGGDSYFSGGNVGINTTSPSGANLEIFTGSTSSDGLKINRYSSGVYYTTFRMDTHGLAVHVGDGSNISERAAITPNGITFGGDTAAANALNDYEEGTWTGTLVGTTSNPSTSVTATGYYVKIGEKVSCTIQFTNVNTTGAAGSVRVNGLPFTSNRIWVGGNVMFYSRFNINNVTGNIAPYHPGDQQVSFYQSSDDAGWAEVTHSAGTGAYLWFTIEYAVSLS